MKTVLLIRHGENDSLGKYLPGQLGGIHLNEAGRLQANQVAESLASTPIAKIISSPLERAVETATPLTEKLGLTTIIEPGFMEMNTGSWTGLRFPEIKEDPLWEKLRAEPENHAFPDGESFVDASERLWKTLIETVSGQAKNFHHCHFLPFRLHQNDAGPGAGCTSEALLQLQRGDLLFKHPRLPQGQDLPGRTKYKAAVPMAAQGKTISKTKTGSGLVELRFVAQHQIQLIHHILR